ncbi:MAG: M23 family metallopeptidase [Actinomycetota bacterium]|nr:M23 family metallopeptidase [Actinomycetota bacterium]
MCLVVLLSVGGSLVSPGGDSSWAGARTEAGTLGRTGTATLQAGSIHKERLCPEEPVPGNLLSPEVSSMDSVDGWSDGGNARLAQSTEQAVDGAASLELAALAGGTMTARTTAGRDAIEVVPGYTYDASAQFRANRKLRPVSVAISWYGLDDEALDVTSGGSVPEAAGQWAVATHSSVAPKGAAYAGVAVTVTGAFPDEKHYVDAVTFEASSQDAPVCEPGDDDGGGHDDGEPNPDDGGGDNGNNDNGNNDNGTGGGVTGNGGNGNGGTGTGNGNNDEGEEPSGDGHGSGADPSSDDPDLGDSGPARRGSPDRPDGRDPADPPSQATPGSWHPIGPYSTGSLMTAALRLKALGWSEGDISRKVFAPFIIGGEAGWTDTWGAPRSGGRSHEGQDVFCNYGDPVLATEDGTVEFDDGGLGGRVARLHRPDGSYWYYAHLSDWNTERFGSGDAVATGDIIGYCGNTGNAIFTPPHVHFGFYTAKGNAINPMGKLVGWLQVAQKRTLGYVEKITDRRVLEIDRLTSARRFGDGFIPTPSDEAGPSTDILLASRSLRMFSALQAALSRSGSDLEATDSAGDLVDPELLHFRLWLSSNELPGFGPTSPAAPHVGP